MGSFFEGSLSFLCWWSYELMWASYSLWRW